MSVYFDSCSNKFNNKSGWLYTKQITIDRQCQQPSKKAIQSYMPIIQLIQINYNRKLTKAGDIKYI